MLSQAKEKRKELEECIRILLKENVDYGYLPNTDKRCLFKSGAEKLCEAYGYYKRTEMLGSSAMKENETMYFAYEIKVSLYDKDTGQTIAEGVGSCNSKERKYAKQNPYDVANTILKMAKKRALVDAVLNATASSDIFTQDMEEESTTEALPIYKEEIRTQPEQEKQNASEKQVDFIEQLLSAKGIGIEQARTELRKRYQIVDYRDLSRRQASEFIKILQEQKNISV